MQINSLFYKKTAVCVAVCLIIIILFVFAVHSYPVSGGDSILYVPAAINLKLGNGFVNQLSPLFLNGDPTGAGRFLSLPPLWPIVLHWFMSDGSSESAYIATYWINALTILLAGILYTKIIMPDWRKASWYSVIVCVSALFSLASISIFYPGRPETLTRFLMIVSLFSFLMPRKRLLWILLGTALGLSAIASPGPAILLAPLIGIFFAFLYPTKKALKLILLAYATSIAVSLSVIEMFSYGIAPVVHGLYRHFFVVQSGNLGDHFQEVKVTLPSILNKRFALGFLAILTTSGSAAFAGSVFSLSFVCVIKLYWRWKQVVASRILLYVFAIMTAGSLFLFLVLRPVGYYILALVPLSIVVVGYYAANVTRSNALKTVSLAILMLSSMTFFHRLVLFPTFLASGVSLAEAREKFEQLPLKPNERIGVDGTIWPVSEKYDQMYLWGDEEDVKYPTTTIIMREGLNGWTELPEAWSYCKKTKDFSMHKKPVLFGVTLARAIPGYAFNVYDCSSGRESVEVINP